MEYVEFQKIRMKASAELSERWVQEKLEANGSLLGLGELDVRDAERRQPVGGRLDMLLADPDTSNACFLSGLGTVSR